MRKTIEVVTPIFGLRDDDFVLQEEDVIKTVVDDIGSLRFSDRVHALVEKGMKATIIVKLLGRKIRLNLLQNRLYAIWKLKGTFSMIDLDNDYYHIRFSVLEDYTKALAEVVYGHNLSGQHWSTSFTTTEPFPANIVSWVRISGGFYREPLLEVIGEMVGKIIKIDENTTESARGRFILMAVTVDLSKPLISK